MGEKINRNIPAQKAFIFSNAFFIQAVFISLCIVALVLPYTWFYYKKSQISKHVKMTEKQSILIAELLSEKARDILFEKDDNDEWRLREFNEKMGAALDSSMRPFLRAYNILKIKIYTLNTKIVYSTDTSIIGLFNKDNEQLNRAFTGRTSSKWERKDSIRDVDEEEQYDVEIVETYVPIFGRRGNVIGSFEMYHDLTEHFRGIIFSGRRLVIGLGFVLIILLSGLCVLAYIAQKVIHRNALELQDERDRMAGSAQVLKNEIENRKKVEEDARLSSQRYQMVFENSAVSIMLADDKERIVSWNTFTEKLFDMKSEDLYLKQVKSLYPEDEWRKIRAQDVRRKGMQHHLETKSFKGNGDVMDVDLSLTVMKDSEQKVTGSIAIIRDITERKAVEKRLQIEKHELEIFQQAAIDQELRIITLKKEVNAYLSEKGLPIKYTKSETIKLDD